MTGFRGLLELALGWLAARVPTVPACVTVTDRARARVACTDRLLTDVALTDRALTRITPEDSCR